MLHEPVVEGNESLTTRTTDGVTQTPVWFGGPDRPLFGWLEVPEDRMACAGVVICPPLAVESTTSKPGLRTLSTRLAAEGCAVLRFDYAATGDSAGDDREPAQVAGWLASIRSAMAFLESVGCTRISLVGLRIGATLVAAELSTGGPAAAAVLWDPYPAGRMYVRQQGVLARMMERERPRDDGSVEGPGIVMSPETVSDLRDLKLTLDRSVADRVLLLTRAGRSLPADMATALHSEHVEWQEIEGQEAFIDVDPVFAALPDQTVDVIVGWLLKAVGNADRAPVVVPEPTTAVIARGRDSRAIRERPVSLGPNGLFGIETVPERVDSRPPVLFLNAGVIDHVGPARAWVTLARALAAQGFRTVRFDLSGVGATPRRPGADQRSTVTLAGIQDVADVQRAIAPDDPSHVVLVGLCSGGYHCSEATLSTGTLGVVMINPSFRLLGVEDTLDREAPVGDDLQRKVDEAPRAWVKRIPGRAALWELVRRAPDPLWTVINRLAINHPPAETLKQMRDAGTDVFVPCDDYDAWVLQRGARRELKKSNRTGRVRIQVVEGMDHTLFFQEGRDQTVELVVDHVVSQFSTSRVEH